MKERKPILLHSEPIREIMGNPPGKLVRAGTALIFILFLFFILFAWLLRYPDIIPSQIEITTENPPITLVSKVTGHIKKLYVNDKEIVHPGQLLAVMETTASVDEINSLRNLIDTLQDVSVTMLPDFRQLGELQEYYSSWRKNLINLFNYDSNDFYGNKINSVNQEIAGIKEYLKRLAVKESLFAENLRIEAGKFRRDSLLFAGKIIPESQLEISRQQYLRLRLDYQQVKLDQSAKMIELAEKQQLLQDYIITKNEERDRLSSILEESSLNLRAQTNIWINTYYLVSDVEGTATFTKFWSANQSVTKDEPVLSIVPLNAGNYIGRTRLRMQRSGKVEEGQFVNIKLTGYPYLEYGMVRGVVRSKSLVPSGEEYIIEIDLPDGLKTLYGKNLEFSQNMLGIAEIITEDVRLLQKLINPFRHLISKNRRSGVVS
ncbi:MAG TPA: hypothetical protein VK213_00835 [Bacteroidales bacterium]|nr:hypothetical protein [Bacteroidales bacterium]